MIYEIKSGDQEGKLINQIYKREDFLLINIFNPYLINQMALSDFSKEIKITPLIMTKKKIMEIAKKI